MEGCDRKLPIVLSGAQPEEMEGIKVQKGRDLFEELENESAMKCSDGCEGEEYVESENIASGTCCENHWDMMQRSELDEERIQLGATGQVRGEEDEEEDMTGLMDQDSLVPYPALSDFQSKVGERLRNAVVVFTVHNMAYQGRNFLESLEQLGYPRNLTRY